MQYGRSSSALLTCRYILKSILYDPAMRTDMLILPCSPDRLDTFLSGVNISSSRPFMLQQLMHGPEFSCYALAHKGRLVAHSDTAACISNLNFKHLGRPEIQDFTARLCSALKLDGQVRLLPGLRFRQIAASLHGLFHRDLPVIEIDSEASLWRQREAKDNSMAFQLQPVTTAHTVVLHFMLPHKGKCHLGHSYVILTA